MSLQTLFNPKSIAVIGASTTPGAVGHIVVQNLINEHYPGKVFPVNPKTDTLLDLPCYASVKDIQESVDLAIIVVPAKIVPEVLQEVAEANITTAIIISAGFKETGVKGKVLEKQVTQIATENNITLLGPNCLGFLRSSRCLNASFAKSLPRPGKIAFFSQSGALCTTLLNETEEFLGYSHLVSIGNKATLKEKDFLEYFLADQETEVIAFYTEELSEGEQLIELGKKALLNDPPKSIIVLKSGSTEAGSTASSSHTGAVAGSDYAYQTLFQEAGFNRAETFADLSAMLSVFSQNKIPDGNRLAIVTNAGGMGVLTTDVASKNGTALASFEQNTTQDLGLCLPTAAGTHNPVDVLGDADAERYQLALQLVAKDPNVDMILVIVTPQAMTEGEKTAEVLIKLRSTCSKPLVAVFTEGTILEAGRLRLQEAGISVLTDPEKAVRALARFAHIPAWQKKLHVDLQNLASEKQKAPVLPFSPEPRLEALDTEGYLEESVVRHTLEQYGFTFPKTVVVTSQSEVKSAEQLFTSPVVMKIISADILHKSDVGGVILDVAPKNIEKTYDVLLETVKKAVPKAKIEGVLIAEMVRGEGLELLLGLKEEQGLGRLIVIGVGGIYVEVLQDIAGRFVPVQYEEALQMLQELKSFPILQGIRGQKGMNLEVLAKKIVTLSDFAMLHPEVSELDINPLVFTTNEDFLVLDARIRVKKLTKALDTKL